MSSVPRYIPYYTLDDYRQWEGDWELIDGVAIAMTPSPFGPHERIISRLSRMIGNQLDLCQCACEVYTNLDWIVCDNTVIRPDLMVVCGEQPQQHLGRRPEIVVEVLSESTKGRDLTAKRAVCRESDVPHYLIIDPETKTVEQVSGKLSNKHEVGAHFELLLEGHANCTINIECSDLFDSTFSC